MALTWRTMIEALQRNGVTLETIAGELEISVRMVCYLKAEPNTMPKYDVGNRLIVLYSKHCTSTSTSAQSVMGPWVQSVS